MAFKEWLSQISRENGGAVPEELRAILVRHDCHCGETQLREWLTGESEPSFDKMRAVLSALQKELADMDVWEHYKRSNESGPQTTTVRSSKEASLESVLRDNPRLPPGLSDV